MGVVGIGKGRLGIKVTSALAVLLAAGLLASVAAIPAQAATLNVTGIWQAVYHCTSGPCASIARPCTRLTQPMRRVSSARASASR